MKSGMFSCCILPRCHSTDGLPKEEPPLHFSTDAVAPPRSATARPAESAFEPKGSSGLMQRYNERVNTSEPATPAAEEPTLPDMTYRSLSCNSRIAQQKLLEVMSRSPASSKHLQVPQNAITHETLQGRPYPVTLGPPPPAVNDARVATALDIKDHLAPGTAKLDALLQLAVRVLELDIVLVSLLDGDRQNALASIEFADLGIPAYPPAICHWSLVPSLHQMVIVEDTLEDARTRNNAAVVGNPWLRFYCSAPLVASNGHRIGTLCCIDKRPQRMDQERAAILCNIAELVIRELEMEWAAQAQRAHTLRLLRTMDCYKEAFMFVDGSVSQWRVLYMNEQAIQKTGVTRWNAAGDMPFWALFSLGDQPAPWKSFEEDISEKRVFTVQNVRCDSPHLSASRRFNLIFRPATSDSLDEDQQMIGVPSTASLPGCPATGSMFFVVVCPVNRTAARRPLPFDNLKLSSQLGKGSYGRVYRGIYEGKPVAVKVIHEVDKVQTEEDGTPTEAKLTQRLTHPSIVGMHAYKLVEGVPRQSPVGQFKQAASLKRDELWLILEFCDSGSVQEAVDRGLFREHRAADAPPNMGAILATAQEIAFGMAFLHEQGIVHGDLAGGNVLLSSSEESSHGFRAKISDFGLARDIGTATKLETRTYGTITHMAPEVLTSDYISKAADVYSFGVLCWEMLAGQRAWAGMNTAQIIHAVAIQKKQLQLPEGVAPPFKSLLNMCMAANPAQRLAFTQIVSELQQLAQKPLEGVCDVAQAEQSKMLVHRTQEMQPRQPICIA